MKKSHHYTKLSNTQCVTKGCGRFLKQRIVQEKPTATKCYDCYVSEKRLKSLNKNATNK